MAEPVYFAVLRVHGHEYPVMFYERVPPAFLAKGDQRLVYCTRIDSFPNGEAMIAAPLAELMMVWRTLTSAGKAPPEDRGTRPPPAKAETRLSHERWRPPEVTWDRDAPAYPPPPARDPEPRRGYFSQVWVARLAPPESPS